MAVFKGHLEVQYICVLENKSDLRSVSITFRVHAQLSINGQVRLEFSMIAP